MAKRYLLLYIESGLVEKSAGRGDRARSLDPSVFLFFYQHQIHAQLVFLYNARNGNFILLNSSILHHSHTSHAAHASHGRTGGTLLIRGLNNGNLGGAQQGSNTAGVNETGADNLERVEDTGLNHVNVLALGAVKAPVEVGGVLIGELANDNGTLQASVLDNGAGRAGDGVLDNVDAEPLVKVGRLDVSQSLGRGLDQGSTTTGQDTLLDGSTGGVEGIDKSILLLADLDLGGATNLDDSDAARELGKTLLELLLLVLGGGGVSGDTADLLAALRDGVLGTLAVEDDGVLLGDGDGAGGAEHVNGGLFELDVELVGEDGALGQDTNVTKNGLSVVAKAGSLDSGNLELATELVQDADGKGLAVNVLGNDDKRAAGLRGDFQSRDDVLDSRDLLLGEENQGVLELDLLGLGVGDEVGGDETSVEAHALGNLELILHGLALLDGDDALLANLLHGIGNHLADVVVAVGRNGGDLGDLGAGGNVALVLVEVLNNRVNGSLDTTAEIHGVAAGSHVLYRLGEDGPGEDGSGRGTVTSDIVGLGGHVLE
ncbi:hypothetical protein E5D57_001325 [Metarhizium anisopliae]|nr:hypothetical protein E5D57_001325 [Metarhizium anisopliae]